MAKLSKLRLRFLIGITVAAGLFVIALHAPHVYAQTTGQPQPGDVGLQQIQQTSGLGSNSLGTIIAGVIRIFLSLLGVITIGVIIYGGFEYMTAGGSEETMEKAKRMLVNGVIGLVIILASFGISEFLIRSFLTATGTQIAGVGGQGADVGIAPGGGALSGGAGFGSLVIKFAAPKGAEPYANVKVNVVFNQDIDSSSVSATNFTVKNKAGDLVPGTTSVTADTLTFTPTQACPAPNASLHCFTADTYTVTLLGGDKNSIRSVLTSKILSCTGNCTFSFSSGTEVDTTPPVISNTKPLDNGKIPGESYVPISALLSDLGGVAYGKIFIDGKLLETVEPTKPPTGTGQDLQIQSNKFTTKGDAIGAQHVIELQATDLAGNTGKAQIHTTTYAPHCFDKVKDGDEIAIDCSAAKGECGLCSNAACVQTSQCAAGSFCDTTKLTCVSSPLITDVQPQDGAPGTFVTITGEGFGTGTGFVTFLGDPKTDTDDVQAGLACSTGWSSNQVVVQVPATAKTGPIQIKNLAGSVDQTDNQTGLFLKEFTVNTTARPGICGLSPEAGVPGTKVQLLGTNDIAAAGVDRKLFFGGYSATDVQWAVSSPNSITASVPNADAGFLTVEAVIKGMTTNPLAFLVNAPVSAAGTGGGAGSGTGTGAGASAGGAGGGSGTSGGANVNVLHLNSVAPLSGGVGTYLTLTGTGFGIVPNKVYFVALDAAGNPSGQQVAADTNFPAQCAASFWANTQIVVKVPNIPVATYGVRVYPLNNKDGSNVQNFKVDNSKPGPQVCAIKANNGPANGVLAVALYGENFGTVIGGAIFSNNDVAKATGVAGDWTDGKAVVLVPVKAVSGPVQLALADPKTITGDFCAKNPTLCSNSIFFNVADCRVTANVCSTGTLCCVDGTCGSTCGGTVQKVSAAFLWCFSTGDSCDVSKPPQVIEECAKTGDATKTIPSPSPSLVWSQPGAACNNGLITVKFTENVDPATVNISQGSKSSIVVEKCTDSGADPCVQTDPTVVPLKNLKVSPYDKTADSTIFVTPVGLSAKSTYRVSLTSSIVGIDSGLPIVPPPNSLSKCTPPAGFAYCFTFSTGQTNDPCAIDVVGVSPASFIANNFGPLVDTKKNKVIWFPTPYPADHCQILDPSAYTWAWTPANKGDAGFDVASAISPGSTETQFLGKTPTADNKFIDVAATTMQSGAPKSGKGALAINPGPPSIYEQCSIGGIISPSPSIKWPGSDAICNAPLITVTFDNPVVHKNTDGTDAPFTSSLLPVTVSECTGTKTGHECDTVVSTPIALTLLTQPAADQSNAIYPYTLQPAKDLALNTWYVGEVAAGTKVPGVNGKSIVPMTGCRPGVAYCFTFKTAATIPANDAACKLTSISITPSMWNASDYGVQVDPGTKENKTWTANAFGPNACVFLQASKYNFAWGIDTAHAGFAAIDPDGLLADTLSYQYIAAYRETVGNPLSIFATAEKITGAAAMNIKFTNPTIDSYDPTDCGGSSSGVCLNAQIGITFSTNMDIGSIKDKVYLYECPVVADPSTDTCDVAASDLKNALVGNADLADSHHIIFASTNFDASRKYRIVVKSGVLSAAELPFADFNYPAKSPTEFSWTFVTGDKACAIDKVKVKPVDAVAQSQNQLQQFAASAFGQADACHPNGQPLNAAAYQWSWKSSDTSVADEVVASTTAMHTYKMIAKGAVVSGYQSTQISAAAMSKSDVVPWKLQCNATAASCPSGTVPGKDGCCYAQPGITKVDPPENAIDICRNTLIDAYVGDFVNTTSVSSTSFMIGYQVADAHACADGTFDTDGNFCFKKFPYTLDAINQGPQVGVNTSDQAFLAAEVGALLPANTLIKVKISKTNAADSVNADQSVQTQSGVAVTGKTWTFRTGPNPCALSKVNVYPANMVFTQLNAPAHALAIGLSHQGSFDVPIASIAGEYDWTWEWLPQAKQIAQMKSFDKNTGHAVLQAGGNNGKTVVAALATIGTDKYFTPSSSGTKIAGQLPVLATICEVPWYAEKEPTLTSILDTQHLSFWYCETPNGQDQLPDLVPVVDQISDASSNVFTTLNAFHLVDPVSGGAIGFRVEKNLKSYSPLEWYYQKNFKGTAQPLTVAGLNAVRVGNTLYVAFGKPGDAKDANSYTNMLIMSLSDPATPGMQAIFDQIVANMQTATNLVDQGLCYQNAAPSDAQCNKNADCSSAPQTPLTTDQNAARYFVDPQSTQYADLGKTGFVPAISCQLFGQGVTAYYRTAKYELSTNLLTPVFPVSDSLLPQKYLQDPNHGNALENNCENTKPSGECSIKANGGSLGISCYKDSDCPNNGTCTLPTIPTSCNIPYTKFVRDTNRVIDAATLTRALSQTHAIAGKYPLIATGSFVSGLVSSAWPQWSDFMSQLGIGQVADPLNNYVNCTGAFDSATCWNAAAKLYQCNAGSEVYHYQAVHNGDNYTLGVTFEQDSGLTSKWQGDDITAILSAQNPNKLNGAFCTDTPYTPQSICGDGAIGTGEQCDPPGKIVTVSGSDAPASSCPYGVCTSVCTPQCQLGALVPVNKCGDGIVESPEKCDDGQLYNGKYNHCSATCGITDSAIIAALNISASAPLGLCGDGTVQKNEMCDVGTNSGAVFSTGQTAGDNNLEAVFRCNKLQNGHYEALTYNLTTHVLLPDTDSTRANTYVDGYHIANNALYPTIAEVCSTASLKNYIRPNDGKQMQYGLCGGDDPLRCVYDGTCPYSNGNLATCIPGFVGSKYAFKQADSCNWDCKATGPYCNDGIVEPGEQCDGNQVDSANSCVKKCNTDCTWKNATAGVPVCEAITVGTTGTPPPPVGCGDGKLDSGAGEECDSGTDPSKWVPADPTKPSVVGGQNGIACTPQYGQNNSCQFCTLSCKKAYVTGGFCGDGIVNGNEVCDKNDLGSICSGKGQYGTQICKSDCSGTVAVAKPQVGDEVVGLINGNWITMTAIQKIYSDGSLDAGSSSSQTNFAPGHFALIGASSTIETEPAPFLVGMRVGVRPAGGSTVWKIGYLAAIKNSLYDVKFEDGTTATGVALKDLARIPDICLSCGAQSEGWSGATGSTLVKTPITSSSALSFSFIDPTLPWLPEHMIGELYFGDESAFTGKQQVINISSVTPPTSQIDSLPAISGTTIVNATKQYTLDNGPSIVGQLACYGTDKQYRAQFESINAQNLTNQIRSYGGAFSYQVPEVLLSKPNLGNQSLAVEPNGQPGDYRVVVTGIEHDPAQNKDSSQIYVVINSSTNVNGVTLASNNVPTNCANNLNGWVDSSKSTFDLVTSQGATNNAKSTTILAWIDGCENSAPFAQIESAVEVDNTGADLPGSRMFVITTHAQSETPTIYPVGTEYQFEIQPSALQTAPVNILIYYRNGAPDAAGHYWQLKSSLSTKNMTLDSGGYYYPFAMYTGDGTQVTPTDMLYQGKLVAPLSKAPHLVQ